MDNLPNICKIMNLGETQALIAFLQSQITSGATKVEAVMTHQLGVERYRIGVYVDNDQITLTEEVPVDPSNQYSQYRALHSETYTSLTKLKSAYNQRIKDVQ